MHFKKTALVISIAISAVMAPQNGHAQNGALPNFYYDLSTVRTTAGDPGDFSLRLTSPAALSGCVDITPPSIETVDAGSIIFIRLTEGEISAAQKPRYGHSDCTMTAAKSYVDIPLNKDALEENKTTKLDIKSELAGKLYDIELDPSDDKITLSTTIRTRTETKDIVLDHWFYPQNTVILSTPGMEKDPQLADEIKDYAMARGMQPLEAVLDSFPIAKSHAKELFFVDTKNLMKETLKDGGVKQVGTTKTSETYYNADGPYEKTVSHPVFARKPGKND